MNISKAVVYSVIMGVRHPGVPKQYDSDGMTKMGEILTMALFPGVDPCLSFYNSDFLSLYTKPVLKKLFPEVGHSFYHEEIKEDETVEIDVFLPADGKKWQKDPEWRYKFMRKLWDIEEK